MPAQLGLDIGRSSIKAVQLEKLGAGKFTLQAIGKIASPPKWIESEAEADKKSLAEAIKTLLREASVKAKITLASLPDSRIYTRLLSFPLLTNEELSSAIQWEADQYVPIPLDKVQLHWQIVEKQSLAQGGKMEVLLLAAPKLLTDQYVEIITKCGLDLKGLETESMALARSLIGQGQNAPTSLVVSIGSNSTDLSILHQGQVILTRSIATGGQALSRAAIDKLGFDPDQAEAYKNAYGILKDKLGGKLANALLPIVEIIVNETKRTTTFYLEQRPSDPIKRAVLCGGPAQMPGLVVYLAEQLGYEVVVGDPWSQIEIDPAIAEGVRKESAEYAIAVGLAMREIK